MYDFMKKYRRYIYSFLGVSITGFIFLLLEKKIYIDGLSIHRCIIYLLVLSIVFISLFFDYKKVWDFIFRKRYYIGILLFVFMVAMGYNTSSIGMYDSEIQPNIPVDRFETFWNTPRSIRSDEFIAASPTLFSQKLRNNYKTFNDAIMGRKTSVLLLPRTASLSISILASPQLLGFLFLDVERAFSVNSLLSIFLSFFSIFELFLVITNRKKKLSLLGTLLILCSPSTLWWNSQSYFWTGAISVLMFNNFLKSTSTKKRIIYSILLGLFGSSYVILSYPAWQVPYGYMYLLIMIWMIIKNKENIKIKYFWYLFISIAIVGIIVVPAYIGSRETLELISNTVYPGSRNSTGGSDWKLLFQYFSSILYGIKDCANPSAYSQYLSLYPIPILLGGYQCIKNRRNHHNDYFLLFMTLFAFILNIWNYIPIGIISKLTLLNMSTPERSQLVVGVSCIFILIKWLSDYEIKEFRLNRLVTGGILGFIIVLISIITTKSITPEYLTPIKTGFLSILFFTIIVIVVLNNKDLNKILFIVLLCITIFNFMTVNPLTNGTTIMFDKPFAKEVQKIVKKDKNALWISANTSLYTSNYVLANGARVINSVNYYPNMELWKRIDKNNKYEDIYNRYAHVIINFTNEKTHFNLEQSDYFTIYLNNNDACKLNIDYIATSEPDFDKYSNDNIKLSKIYSEDNTSIFKIKCYK